MEVLLNQCITSIGLNHNVRGILLGWWWCYLVEHLDTNATNYFVYQWVAPRLSLPPPLTLHVQGAPASQASQYIGPHL